MADVIMEEQIERAQAVGRERLSREPRALEAKLSDDTDELLLALASGETLRLPSNQLQGLAGASSEALKNVEIVSGGLGLHWEELDADLLVPELVRGIYGTQSWMRAIGVRGGRASTEAKRQAAQENGAKGGRPRTSKPQAGVKNYNLRIECKVVRQQTQWIGVLRANNGRSLLWTKIFPEKNDVVGCWELIKKSVTNEELWFERRAVDSGWQFEVRTRDGTPLGFSAPYASKSTASRARSTLSAAIDTAHFDETQIERPCG